MSLPTPFGLHLSTTEFDASDALRLSQRLIHVGDRPLLRNRSGAGCWS